MTDEIKQQDKRDSLHDRIETAVFNNSVDNQDPVYNAKKEVLVPYIKTGTDIPENAGGKDNVKKHRAGKAAGADKQNKTHNTRKESLGPNIGR